MKLHIHATLNPIRVLTAAPKLLEKSVFYLKLRSSAKNARYLELSFYSPDVRRQTIRSYNLEVGDWDKDQNFQGQAVRRALRQLVYPLMREDVHIDDLELFEKILRKVASAVYDQAIEYFEVPLADKNAWQRVIRLDISKMLDTKVQVVEPDGEIQKVATK